MTTDANERIAALLKLAWHWRLALAMPLSEQDRRIGRDT